MTPATYYCVKCGAGHNKLIGVCLRPGCDGRMAERQVYLRYIRRFQTLKTMTPEQIDKLEAGRELDALVGEKVFNYDGICQVVGCSERHDPRYSTDIAAAWLVVEKLREQTSHVTVEFYHGDWYCYARHSPIAAHIISAEADTAPLAICRAALKAVASQQDEPQLVTFAQEIGLSLAMAEEYVRRGRIVQRNGHYWLACTICAQLYSPCAGACRAFCSEECAAGRLCRCSVCAPIYSAMFREFATGPQQHGAKDVASQQHGAEEK